MTTRSLPIAGALLSLAALAAPAPAGAAPCAADSLAAYIALGAGGCEIATASFRSFATLDVPFGAEPLNPADVLVSPLLDDPLRPGLLFTLEQSAAAGELFEILIGYQVLAPSLQGVEVALDAASVIEDGAITAVEDVCLDGTFDPGGPTGCTGDADDLVVFDVGIDAEALATLGFADVGLVSVIKDIAIDAGLEGSASLGGVRNRFLVPEPSTALLLGAGLLAAARRPRARH
jgi:hypothetical protein